MEENGCRQKWLDKGLSYNAEEIRPEYIPKHNSICKNQLILLMIKDNEKGHYVAVKKLFALFRNITSKHDGYFYCLNCLHLFCSKNKPKEHENVCKNHDFYIEMPKEEIMLKYNHGEKSMEISFIIYADIVFTWKNRHLS